MDRTYEQNIDYIYKRMYQKDIYLTISCIEDKSH
jgi:hypothetical protein